MLAQTRSEGHTVVEMVAPWPPMRWLLATMLALSACTQPKGQTPEANSPGSASGPSEDDAPPVADEDEPLTWHTLKVGDAEIEYATVGTPTEGRPVLLALPPGPQTREMVAAGIEKWASAMEEAGWFVLSPVSPEGLFFTDSADVLPGFIDAATKAHAIPSDGLLLFGMSNGGLSAFKLALSEPSRFRAIVTIPGRPTDDDLGKVSALAGIPVAMVVGADDDPFWLTGAESTKSALESAGGTVELRVLPETGHAAHIDIDWDTFRGLFGL